MSPEDFGTLLNLLVNGGGTAILVWLVVSMRQEAKADREWMKQLLMILLENDRPDLAAQVRTRDSLPPTS